MLAYAANAPRNAERRSSPNAMLAIIAAHVALVALVMSARMDLPVHFRTKPLEITRIDPVRPPPQPLPHQLSRPRPGPRTPHPFISALPPSGPEFATGSANLDPAQATEQVLDSQLPEPGPSLSITPLRRGPELLTTPAELKPPYPPSKLLAEEEAVLNLRLTIDDRGRVIAVEPIGRADAVFLAAARRHLIAHWRYRPASQDGRAVASTMAITLRFQLDG